MNTCLIIERFVQKIDVKKSLKEKVSNRTKKQKRKNNFTTLCILQFSKLVSCLHRVQDALKDLNLLELLESFKSIARKLV